MQVRVQVYTTDDLNCVAFSPNARQLASCSLDNKVTLWDTTTWQQVRVLEGHTSGVWKVSPLRWWVPVLPMIIEANELFSISVPQCVPSMRGR